MLTAEQPTEIVLMWDWTSSGLWDADRTTMLDPRDIGLSDGLRERLANWVASGEALSERQFLAGDDVPAAPEEEAFAAEQVRLLELLREELAGQVRVGIFRDGQIRWE